MLAEALHTDIAWIRRHTEFGEQARNWALADRPKGLLLRSPLLEEAERWIVARPQGALAPTEETQFFIRHSRRAATRQRRGRALVYVLLVGVVTGVIAWMYLSLSEIRSGNIVVQSAKDRQGYNASDRLDRSGCRCILD